MTGLVTVTVTKRLPLAKDFAELEQRAQGVRRALQVEGFTIESWDLVEYRDAEAMDGEVRA
jgi:hypothetical protein